MTTTNLSDLLPALLCGLGCDARGCGFCLEIGQVDPTVDVIEADLEASRGSEGDQPGGRFRRHGLTALVVANVPLSASHAVSKGLLGHIQAFSDGFDGVHRP